MTKEKRLHAWLQKFAECVRTRDIKSGKTLFSSGASGFGTRTQHARNREELIEHQWIPTWNNTRDFSFISDTVSFLFSNDESVAVAMARWTSVGVKPDGQTFSRNGRCTVILRSCSCSPFGYVALHTHFSKNPTGEL